MEKIDYDVVDDMRRRFETWTSIASHCGVSISSLKRWRQLVQYEDPYPLLDGEELDAMVEPYLAGQMNRGMASGLGYIKAKGFRVRRQDYPQSYVSS